MAKYFSLITAASEADAAEFRRWFLTEHAPQVARWGANLHRYMINLREEPLPAADNMMALAEGPPAPRFEVITEMWFDSSEPIRDGQIYGVGQDAQRLQAALAARAGKCFLYRVTENVEKDAHPVLRGERSQGVKMIPLIGWKDGLSDAEGRLGWEVHGPLAMRTHVGFSKYVRNVVDEVLTPDAPRYGGIGVLQFLTRDDAIHRLLPTPDAGRIIAFDTARWLVVHDNSYFAEYVLK
jgi:EthD domain